MPLSVARDHPAFAGHFPGHPMLPGALLLAEVMAAVGEAPGRAATDWKVSSAKFLAPVPPGMALVISHETDATGAVRFEVQGAEGLVASGTLVPRR
jgi:3-hydroxymyristoyl/3-hydroxydecanoyl-(acyl carrier protein) dehydratase